ncbi:Beta-hexosaminidase subunit beta [Manis javanica]|nr:Beta-hexosaminidase subunit beta [Manis javanica]
MPLTPQVSLVVPVGNMSLYKQFPNWKESESKKVQVGKPNEVTDTAGVWDGRNQPKSSQFVFFKPYTLLKPAPYSYKKLIPLIQPSSHLLTDPRPPSLSLDTSVFGVASCHSWQILKDNNLSQDQPDTRWGPAAGQCPCQGIDAAFAHWCQDSSKAPRFWSNLLLPDCIYLTHSPRSRIRFQPYGIIHDAADGFTSLWVSSCN